MDTGRVRIWKVRRTWMTTLTQLEKRKSRISRAATRHSQLIPACPGAPEKPRATVPPSQIVLLTKTRSEEERKEIEVRAQTELDIQARSLADWELRWLRAMERLGSQHQHLLIHTLGRSLRLITLCSHKAALKAPFTPKMASATVQMLQKWF
jgi:hypothetical protein